MSLGSANPLRVLSIPEIPRITGGLVLAAAAVGHVVGAGGVSGETLPELAIVAVSSVGLLVSGVIVRSSRVARINQRSADLFGSREFRREFIRARRHESPLTLVRIPGPPDTARAGAECRQRLLALRRGLRRIDLVWLSRGDAYVVMPDTDASSARLVLERLRHRVPAAFGQSEPILAAFPEHGLTVAALLAIVRGSRPTGPDRAPEAGAAGPTTDRPTVPARHPAGPGVPAPQVFELSTRSGGVHDDAPGSHELA